MIKTKNPVTFNSGVRGSTTDYVYGRIKSATWMDDFNSVGVNHEYMDSNMNVFHMNGTTVSGDTIDNMYESVKPSLPTDQPHREVERTKFYLGFAIEMALAFDVDLSEIEIVL